MKACVFTLGCKMNEVESASLMRGLQEMGYEVTDRPEYADLYLLNTCAVTREAERKSRQAVARLRRFNPDAPVYVCGCASERDPGSFLERDGVRLVWGAQGKGELLSHLNDAGAFHVTERAFCELPVPARSRTRAYVRVQDGCNRFCSYCIIPYLRGRSRSRSLRQIVGEVGACTAKEVVLTGIDLSSYRDGEAGLAQLILALKDMPLRVRLGSLEPGAVTDELLSAMHAAGNVMPHFHLSLQSGSDAVLRAMNRHYTREEYLNTRARIVRAFPSAAITTDIIVGFPGEREEDFARSLSIIAEAALARVHCFPFSMRQGTAAAKLRDTDPAVKQERMARILAAAAEQERRFSSRFLGQEAVVLFEDDGGYTENYLRVRAEGMREGALCRVRLLRLEQDGIFAEILEEL